MSTNQVCFLCLHLLRFCHLSKILKKIMSLMSSFTYNSRINYKYFPRGNYSGTYLYLGRNYILLFKESVPPFFFNILI